MPPKLDRCVKKLKRKKGVRNPYAICNAAIKRKRKKSAKRKKSKK